MQRLSLFLIYYYVLSCNNFKFIPENIFIAYFKLAVNGGHGMKLTKKLLLSLQQRLKVGDRRSVYLNAIPGNSRYKFDIHRLSYINDALPNDFISELLSKRSFKFKINWQDSDLDFNLFLKEDGELLVKISKSFENLINQTETIELEKGINTFGFGFPIVVRRDKIDNKLTVAPILIWSLRIKKTKELNAWEICRSEDDPIYLNEVLINHLRQDLQANIEPIPDNMLDDGIIDKDELIEICTYFIKSISQNTAQDIKKVFSVKLNNINKISEKKYYENLPIGYANPFIEFGGLFSIFEVQKQNVIKGYDELLSLEGESINLKDLEGNYFQPISSVETDPSQQNILYALKNKRNLLIQGPPGTGKSQTLTAILVNALECRKKAIVVCEKRTALEVLYNALYKKGLGRYCIVIRDIIKDRKLVVDTVRERLNAQPVRFVPKYSKEKLDEIINTANKLIKLINDKKSKFDYKLIGDKSWTDVVGEFLYYKKNLDEEIFFDKYITSNFKYTHEEQNQMRNICKKAQRLFERYKSLQIKSFLNPDKLCGDNQYALEQSIRDDFRKYHDMFSEIKKLYMEIEKEFYAIRNEEFEIQKSYILSAKDDISKKEQEFFELFEKYKEEYIDSRNIELREQLSGIENTISLISNIFNSNENNQDILDEIKVNSFIFKALSIFSKRKKQTISDQKILRESFQILKKYIEKSKDINFYGLYNNLQINKNALLPLKEKISQIKKEFDEKVQNEFKDINLHLLLEIKISNISLNFLDTKKYIDSFKNYFDELKTISDGLLSNVNSNKDIKIDNLSGNMSFVELQNLCLQLKVLIEDMSNSFDDRIKSEFLKINLLNANTNSFGISALEIFQEKIKELNEEIAKDNWVVKSSLEFTDFYDAKDELEDLLQKEKQYFNATEENFTKEFQWYSFYNSLSEEEKLLIRRLINLKGNWEDIFLVNYANFALDKAAKINGEVLFSDEEHKELTEVLSDMQKTQINYIYDLWNWKQENAIEDFCTRYYPTRVENLYNQREGKKFKRHSLRKIVKTDRNLFTTFFPIVLTSPDICCNLFSGADKYFDIVMFDEASQLKLEDNLPVIFKGNQVIVSGDEHQMPPSNYFSKIFDDSYEDEDDIEEEDEMINQEDSLLSCESLLDFAVQVNFDKKYLDFHYRSKHPYLIDFSNYAFYNKRLKPAPNSYEYVPIEYIHAKGQFLEHANDKEAEIVLDIIDKCIHRFPNGKYPSVGIATFNISQRNKIREKIGDRQRFDKYAVFNKKIEELEKDGMFIKNLENIQGDEKDIIILSTAYGVNEKNRFSQNFGPINHKKGYRLLNVVVTRAKYKMYVCTSIPERYLAPDDTRFGVETNQNRAIFYAYLAYAKSVSKQNEESRKNILNTISSFKNDMSNNDNIGGIFSNNEFEREVYNVLCEKLGKDKLEFQMQFAGFKIDIVYGPKLAGAPKIAIECDGAKHRAGQEAYLYDIHRQKMLEEYGFVLHRIWSVNWWRNAEREINKLIDFMFNVERRQDVKNQEICDISKIFSNYNMQNFENEDNFVQYEQTQTISNDINPLQCDKISKYDEDDDSSGYGDIVTFGSKVRVKYLNNKNKEAKVLIGGQKDIGDFLAISKDAPLSKSLIGHTEGDIVKIGGLDNFVEILGVIN
jgi:superfamily I DNA and/or RNA helicase/very-short-patch-repair endonuclease/transcription elongation GreA/GreB family factor